MLAKRCCDGFRVQQWVHRWQFIEVHDVRNLHSFNFTKVAFDSKYDSEFDSEFDSESYDNESYDSAYSGSNYSDNNPSPHSTPASGTPGTGGKPRTSRNRNGSGNSNSVKFAGACTSDLKGVVLVYSTDTAIVSRHLQTFLSKR